VPPLSVCFGALLCLGLPASRKVGTGVAAKHGVLVKGGAALERVSELKRVVFDKTGTLTMGKPRVSSTCRLLAGSAWGWWLDLVAASGALAHAFAC